MKGTPWGQLPVLEFNGNQLAQSATIARYLARKFKLTGKDEWEAAKCDEYVDAANDLFAGNLLTLTSIELNAFHVFKALLQF